MIPYWKHSEGLLSDSLPYTLDLYTMIKKSAVFKRYFAILPNGTERHEDERTLGYGIARIALQEFVDGNPAEWLTVPDVEGLPLNRRKTQVQRDR